MRSSFVAIFAIFLVPIIAASASASDALQASDRCGERRVGSDRIERAHEGGAAAALSRPMSFTGASPLVYQGFSGCGVGANLWDDPGRTRVSYVRSVDTDPFRRLRDEAFDDERFLDANWQASLGQGTDMGSDFSLYTSDANQTIEGKTVAGGRVWLTGIDDTVHLSSSLAVAGTEIGAMDALAQRHEVDFVALRTSNTLVSGNLAYAEADADFEGTRSPAAANQRSIDVGAEVQFAETRLTFGYHRRHDNIAEQREAPSRIDDALAAGISANLSEVALFVPDRLALRTRIGRSEVKQIDDDSAAATSRSGAAGLSLGWGDPTFHAGMDLDATWNQLRGGDSDQEHIQTAALDIGGRSQGLDISSRLFTRMHSLSDGQENRAGADIGWSFAADIEGREWQSSVRYRVERAAEGMVTWQWTLAAELDALELMGIGSSNETLFAYGELDVNVEESGAGPVPAFGGRLVAGYKF